MKKINKTYILLILPGLLLVVYFCAGILFEPNNVIYIKPFIIPSFMIYAIISNGQKLSKYYLIFVFFFYLNESLLLLWEHSLQLYRAALIASFCGYFTLAFLGYKSIKNADVQTIPSGYTLFVLALNCVFLFTIIYLLASVITDDYINIIIIFNAISTIALGATAVLYLGKFGDIKAYYYFFGVFALIFNDVFVAIGTYFVGNIFLNTLDRVLHFACFYLIFLFVITKRKKEDKIIVFTKI
jgi:hypothetical protein